MKQVTLSLGQVAIVNESDFEWLAKYRWFALWNARANNFYAARNEQLEDGRWTTISMHRQILDLKRGDKRQGDHINHKTLDNRRENLRIVSQTQNSYNSPKQRNNTTGFKGVIRENGRFRAIIGIQGKRIHLGTCATPEEAYALYCEAAKKYHGEFACI